MILLLMLWSKVKSSKWYDYFIIEYLSHSFLYISCHHFTCIYLLQLFSVYSRTFRKVNVHQEQSSDNSEFIPNTLVFFLCFLTPSTYLPQLKSLQTRSWGDRKLLYITSKFKSLIQKIWFYEHSMSSGNIANINSLSTAPALGIRKLPGSGSGLRLGRMMGLKLGPAQGSHGQAGQSCGELETM